MLDTGSYYWLGFSPDWNGDNQNHTVRIELRRPGLEVRHRTELRDLSRSLEISYLVESALLLGGVPGARPLPIQFGQAVKAGFRKLEVPVRIAIPMNAVAMLRRGRRYVADLELRVAVLDEDGNRNELAVLPVKLDGERQPAPGEYAIYETSLQLRRQEHDLVVALYDPVSGTILTCVATWTP